MKIFRSQTHIGLRFRLPTGASVKSEAGQSLAELALTLPLLFLILVGAAEMATVVYDSIAVENAAMAGVQYGSLNSADEADTTGIQNAAAAAAPDLSLTTTVSTSCICSNGASSTCKSTDCSGANIETILTVKTQTTITPFIHSSGLSGITALPQTFTLNGLAVQKVLE